MLSCSRRALLSAATVIVALAAGVSSAHAGIITIHQCHLNGQPVGLVLNTGAGGWTSTGTGNATSTDPAPCSTTTDAIDVGPEQVQTDENRWTFQTPAWGTIVGYRIYHTFAHATADPPTWELYANQSNSEPSGTPIEQCTIQSQCDTIGPESQGSGLAGITDIHMIEVCNDVNDCSTSDLTSISEAQFDVQDNSTPTVTATGPLFSDQTGTQVQIGTLTGTVTASDPNGPGLYEAELIVDGVTVSTAQFGSDPTCKNLVPTDTTTFHTNVLQPCPTSGTATLTLDAGSLAVGTHHVSVQIVDAGENSASPPTAATWTVQADRGTPNGEVGATEPTNARDSAVLRTRWVHQSAGVAHGSTLIGPFGRRHLVAGTLTTSDGKPIANAAITMLLERVGKPNSTIQSLYTDSVGQFVYNTPLDAQNRVIVFTYRAYANDTGYAATSPLTLLKYPHMSAPAVHPTRAGRYTVHGEAEGSDTGQVVHVQIRQHGRWVNIGTAHVSASWWYQTTVSIPTGSRLRVYVPAASDMRGGTSRTVRA